MSKTLLAAFLLTRVSMGGFAEQVTWVGGPGVQGPVTSFGECFLSHSGSDWLSCPGSISIAEYMVHSVGAFPSAGQACTADLDSDGDPDIATASAGSVVLWLNIDGAGNCWSLVNVGSGCSEGSVSAADIDCDGDLDLITGDKWFRNIDGTGLNWEAVPTFSTGTVYSMRTADIDGDGDIDILVSNGYTSYIRIFENLNGLGTSWQNRQISVPPNMSSTLFPADIDGDGDCDFFLYTFDDPLYLEFVWMENVNGTGLVWESHSLSEYGYVWDIDAADLDGDGDTDLLTAGYYGVRAYLNQNGVGSSWQVFQLDECCSREVEAADLDDDGDLDAASSQFNSTDSFLWMENVNGTGTSWLSHSVSGNFQNSDALCCGDVNGSGGSDPVVCSSSSVQWVCLDQDSAVVFSSILDTGCAPVWETISWSGETPAGSSIAIKVRSSSDWTQMGEWSQALYSPASLDSLLEDSTGFFQYCVLLAAGEECASPQLNDILVTWGSSGIESQEHVFGSQPVLVLASNPCFGVPVAVISTSAFFEARLDIFDLTGRAVQSTGFMVLEPGDNHIVLQRVHTGVYYARLLFGENSLSQRLVVLR